MSALDEFFGECAETQVTLGVVHTNWPRAEERVRPVLDALEETMGFSPQGQLRQTWIAGAREYVDNVGTRADLVGPVALYMQEHGLTVKSPRSLIAIALTWRDRMKDTDAARSKYADWDTSPED